MQYHEGVPKRVLEIGAGYGGLARIFKTLHPEIEYTIVDLPESIYFSGHFLELNDIKDIRYIESEDINHLTGMEFDLVINTFSFQEMPFNTILRYIDFIQTNLKVEGFYTCNYYMNDVVTKEQSYDGELPVDDRWEVVYSNYNAPILRVDSSKNFRELYLERVA
jgi:phospholipid N-methyltransferase